MIREIVSISSRCEISIRDNLELRLHLNRLQAQDETARSLLCSFAWISFYSLSYSLAISLR